MKDFKKYLNFSISKDYIETYCTENSTKKEIRRGIRRGLEEHIEELLDDRDRLNEMIIKLSQALGESLDMGVKKK
jgi:hypothetical protein